MLKVIAILFLLFFASNPLLAQDASAQDSLELQKYIEIWQEAKNFLRQRKNEESIDKLRDCLPYFQAHDHDDYVVYALVDLGINYQVMGQYDSTWHYYKKAEKVFEQADFEGETLRTRAMYLYNSWGIAYGQRRQAMDAVDHFLKLIAILEAHPPENAEAEGGADMLIARCYNNIAATLISTNNPELTNLYLDRCIEELKKAGLDENSQLAERTYQNKAAQYRLLGLFQQSLEAIEKSRIVVDNLPDHQKDEVSYAHIDFGIGNTLVRQNAGPEALARAEDHLNSSYEVFKRNGDRYLPYVIYSMIDLNMHLGRYDQMLELAREALQFNKAIYGEDYNELSYVFNYIGKSWELGNNLDSARYYYQKTVTYMDEKNLGSYFPDLYTEVFSNLAELMLDLDELDSALMYSKLSMLVFFDENELEDDFLSAPREDQLYTDHYQSAMFYQRAKLLQQVGERSNEAIYFEAALDHMDLALQQIHMNRRNLFSIQSKASVSSQNFNIYEDAIALATQCYEVTGKDAFLYKAFEFADRSKANSLYDQLMGEYQSEGLDLPEKELLKEKTLLAEINELELKAYGKDPEIEPEQRSEWLRELYTARQKFEVFKVELKEKYPSYHRAKFEHGELIDYRGIRHLLERHIPVQAQLIEYFAGNESYFVFSYRDGELNYLQIPKKELRDRDIQDLLDALQKNQYGKHKNKAYTIYRDFLSPLLDDRSPEQLIIIPDGLLSYLPFDILLTEAPKEDMAYNKMPYLIRRHFASYHYSLHLLAFHQDKESKRSRGGNTRLPDQFLGFAPEFAQQSNSLLVSRTATDRQWVDQLVKLPFASKEVENIRNFFKRGEVFLGERATEAAFKATDFSNSIIHLATHAIIDDFNPMRSKLVFSQDPDGKEDGLLHTYELFQMQLNAYMVSLSACNTGLGEYRKGEGVLSLGAGFMYANVPNILMSFWSIPDQSTQWIMEHFYQEMKAGKNKAEALRNAKLAYLDQADQETANPYFWGAFVFVGNVLGPSDPLGFIAISLVILVALFFIGFFTFRKRKKLMRVDQKGSSLN